MYLDGIPYADLRQLEIVLSPHGFIQGGAGWRHRPEGHQDNRSSGPSDFGLSAFGQWVTIVLLQLRKVASQRHDQRSESHRTGPARGLRTPSTADMTYEMRYTQYKDYNGVMFPGLIHVHQGDPRINPGENYFQVYTKDVKPNLVVNKLPVPEAVRTAKTRIR
jgi:hypothetical protein